MSYLGFIPIIIAFLYLIYGYLGKHMILIFNRYENLYFKDEISFFKIQFNGSLMIFFLNIFLGIFILINSLNKYFILLSPFSIHIINYFVMKYCRYKKYISF